MRRLTSQDAMFLAIEDERTVLSVSALAIIDSARADGSRLTREDIIAVIEERLHLLPPLRWTLAPVPFKLGHPTWVDGDVDLDFHVRELALPPPGDRARLEAQVARLAAHPMDHSRPLWEVYLIHGLDHGRVALLTKLHHAAVDGVSGAEIMSIIFDPSPEGRSLPPAPRHRPEKRPGQTTLMVRGVGSTLRRTLTSAPAAGRAVSNLDQNVVARSIPGARHVGELARRAQVWREQDPRLLNNPQMVTPRTRFNDKISRRRRFSMVSLPMAPVRDLKNDHETTVNDVIVAVCAGALRRWLAANDELPSDPLVAAIPVSIRAAQGQGAFGNEVGALAVPLPTNEPDPVQRLLQCRDELRVAKDRYQAVPATLMRDSTDLIPPMLFGRATRSLVQLGSNPALHPLVNLVISNVPGPRVPLYCAGTQVREMYPVSTLGDSLGLNITIFSYLDQLNIGLLADARLVPDLPDLAQAIRDELDLLVTESDLSGTEA